MKVVFVTIVDGFHYRYLVDTFILDNLLVKNKLSLHIFTIESLMNKVKKKYENILNVHIHELEEFKSNVFTKLYMKKVQLSNKKLSKTLNIKSEKQNKSFSKIDYLISFLNKDFMKRFFYSKYYRNIISELKPDMIITSTPAQKILDFRLLYEANRIGIKTLSPVYSWDNLTAKGPFYFRMNYLIVWNEIMKKEAIDFQDYKKENVFLGGVPVFDIYANMLNKNEEEKILFFKLLNLNLDKKVITITTIPQIYFGSSHNILIEKIKAKILDLNIKNAQILVRPHPMDETDYSIWEKDDVVILDYYGSKPDLTLKNWNPKSDNTRHLALTMKYSDVVINIASTITIDAACFNTPIINLSYDMKSSSSSYSGNIERYYRYTHYEHVVKTNAAKLVYTDCELFLNINKYLDDKSIDEEKRKNLVTQQAYKLDGKSAERISGIINDLL